MESLFIIICMTLISMCLVGAGVCVGVLIINSFIQLAKWCNKI